MEGACAEVGNETDHLRPDDERVKAPLHFRPHRRFLHALIGPILMGVITNDPCGGIRNIPRILGLNKKPGSEVALH
jgi:hypothetical protein